MLDKAVAERIVHDYKVHDYYFGSNGALYGMYIYKDTDRFKKPFYSFAGHLQAGD